MPRRNPERPDHLHENHEAWLRGSLAQFRADLRRAAEILALADGTVGGASASWEATSKSPDTPASARGSVPTETLKQQDCGGCSRDSARRAA